jgi:DNA-binding transcriptional ArsR family regulator
MSAGSISWVGPFDIAAFGELTSDPSRVRMLLSLMDGQARPATELARIAGVSASTASAHLKKLMIGGLVALQPVGRHRYYQLGGDAVAEALEAVSLLRPVRAPQRPDPKRAAFTDARTCWRHVAGRLGVAVFSALERRRLIAMRDAELALTSRGIELCRSLDQDQARWPVGKPCVDLTERRLHLGGSLGTLLSSRFFALGWVARVDDGRTLRVTSKGKREFERVLGLAWPPSR